MFNLAQVLRLCVVREEVGIHQIEVAVEGDEDGLLYERFSHVWHACFEHRALLCIQIPEAFASPQREPEVHLVGRALQSSAVCQYNLDVVVAARVGVYHHSIEHSRVFVLMLYIEVVAWNLTIKDTFWNVQLRALLLHAPSQTR